VTGALLLGRFERRAIFVGLWAPTLWQIGDSLRLDRPERRLRPLRLTVSRMSSRR
jgi:hypothetical protein